MVTSMTHRAREPVSSGRLIQPVVPQSKLSVAMSSLVMNLAGMCRAPSLLDLDRLEAAHVLRHGDLRREALHARCAEEAHDARRVRDDVARVVGLGDGSAVAEAEDVRVDLGGG